MGWGPSEAMNAKCYSQFEMLQIRYFLYLESLNFWSPKKIDVVQKFNILPGIYFGIVGG